MSALVAQAAPFVGPTVDWFDLSPLLVLAGGALLLMVLAALLPRFWPPGAYAVATGVVAAAALIFAIALWRDVQDDGPRTLVGGALELDGFALFLTMVICVTVLLGAMFLDDYLRREDLDGVEVYALMLVAAAGGVIMVSATDLIVLFLGLETLSMALYVMASSHLRRLQSQESGIKYFVLGSFSSAFLLYGIALVYGATGSTNLGTIFAFLSQNVLLEDGLMLAGLALLLVGLGFKVAAVPFHWWVPDVYQGAPSPVVGFMASAAKAAAFAAMLRVLVVGLPTFRSDWQPVLWLFAVLTLLVGSVVAIVQTDVKRMLAYSSISHAGFILLGVEAATPQGTSAALFYLFVYAVMVLGSFGVVTLVARTGDDRTSLEAYDGLGRARPLLAGVFTVLLLSQAGVPFTSGFIAKLGVIRAAAELDDPEEYALAVIAMIAAVVAAFVYLRIIVRMYFSTPREAEANREADEAIRIPAAAGVGLALAVGFTLIVGIVPWWLINLAEDAIPSLAGGG